MKDDKFEIFMNTLDEVGELVSETNSKEVKQDFKRIVDDIKNNIKKNKVIAENKSVFIQDFEDNLNNVLTSVCNKSIENTKKNLTSLNYNIDIIGRHLSNRQKDTILDAKKYLYANIKNGLLKHYGTILANAVNDLEQLCED